MQVAEDGSGTVQVAVSLDPDATSRVPGLASELRLDDLESAGWAVTGPAIEDDGLTWIRASKPFATPAQASVVLAEVAGVDGPLRDFTLRREQSFARTEISVAGSIDLTRGLEAFTDEQLAAALGGLPLGTTIEEIEAEVGAPIDETFSMAFSVDLPGQLTDSNAPEEAGSRAIWSPRLGEAEVVSVQATSEVRRGRTLILAGVAVLAGLLALLSGVVVPIGRWRRRRDLRPRGRHAG